LIASCAELRALRAPPLPILCGGAEGGGWRRRLRLADGNVAARVPFRLRLTMERVPPQAAAGSLMVHEPGGLIRTVRQAASAAAFYGTAVRQIAPRGGLSPRRIVERTDDRLVFVVGAPRSGTTFLAETIASCPGFVDLGETTPLKALIPRLHAMPEDEVARRIRRVVERVRRLALVQGLRGVEQTPETSFVLAAALQAYPRARAVHIVRDGRDVVCSLLERGWLSAGRPGQDDARHPYGRKARFWVAPGQGEEFERASDTRRAAWAWRSYVGAVRAVSRDAVLAVRYEDLSQETERVAQALGDHLGVPAQLLVDGLARAHARSIGRFRRELTSEQVAEVEREAGPLLAELGYA
jgi:hypothetical protein